VLAPHARYGLAWCLVEREQVAEAATLLGWFRDDAAVGADPTLTRSALEMLSWCQAQGEDPEAAEKSFLKFAEQKPDPQALLNGARAVSEAWRRVGQPDRAVNVFTYLTRTPAVHVEALVEATWVLLDAGRLDDAAARLAEAAGVAPRHEGVLETSFFLAEAYFDKGQGQRSIPLYAAVSALPEHRLADEALYKQGFEHLRAGDPAAARPLFERLVKEHGQSPLRVEAQFLAGESAFRLEDWTGAVALLEQVVELAAGHEVMSKARFRLGMALSKLERWEQAEAVLADLAREDPKFVSLAEAELWRARALAALGKDRAAESAFQRVVAQDRGVLAARAQIGLGGLDRRAGRTETALSTFLKVAVLYAHEEEVAQALLLAGECLEELGDQDKARDRYREIVQAHPQSSVAAEAARRLSGS
jgi:tetratricopeptide (TPR) repeat protein